ncbi:MAG TPA: cysteine hydrolase [Burkholderiaceae bacterium]|jgi:nicotinamidase-related amidase
MKKNIHLLVIDPQNDFCDLPAAYLPADPATGAQHAPALPVTGAHADMLRVAELIAKGGAGLNNISVTLDSHHRLDIAHPTFWQRADGSPVSPFTEISAAQVRSGDYKPRNPAAMARVLSYLDTLEAAGRYRLMVWPVHCEIGSWGQSVHADLRLAYNGWEETHLGIVNKITKGSNPWTEHYSAVMAEVPDADDPDTQLNQGFIDMLKQADLVYIAGEAGSHCVKATTEHIATAFGAASMGKLVLLTDCMSPVAGFETQYEAFVRDMAARGAQLATSADALPQLIANA